MNETVRIDMTTSVEFPRPHIFDLEVSVEEWNAMSEDERSAIVWDAWADLGARFCDMKVITPGAVGIDE